MRKAVVANQFYKGDKEDLRKQIESCFTSKFGPGELPGKQNNKDLRGLISPHAGYVFSGPCAAFGYKEIAESKKAGTYVLIGPNHTYPGNDEVVLDIEEDWETPLGSVKVNKELGKKLMEKCSFIVNNKVYHANEHSLEVQLPFLQYCFKGDFKILPIVVNYLDLEHVKEFVKALKEIDEDFVVIASSDFTHYGPVYGYTPFLTNKQDRLYKQDAKAIDLIKNFESEKFIKFLKRSEATICGSAPIVYLIEIMKGFGVNNCKLLKYYTSGDVTKDFNNAVGYGSLVFEK